QVRDSNVGQFALFGHLNVGVPVADGLNEKTFIRLARRHGRTPIAALQEGSAAVETQAAANFLRLGGVTFVALFDQDRTDFLLEELGAVVRGANRWTTDDEQSRRQQ